MSTKAQSLLDKAASAAPATLKEATLKILQLGQEKDVKAVFLTRALNALICLAEQASVVEAASASSNYEMLLRVLEDPEALHLLRKADSLADARLRGLEVKLQLLSAEGGCISSEKAAEILGISRPAVDKRRKQRKLIGLGRGKHEYIYPSWQFDNVGKTISGLESVLQELEELDPWMQTAFMLDPNIRLDGKTPLEELRCGNIEKVLSAARAFGEQGAD